MVVRRDVEAEGGEHVLQTSGPVPPPHLWRDADQLRVRFQPHHDVEVGPDQPIVDMLWLSGVLAVPASHDRRGPGHWCHHIRRRTRSSIGFRDASAATDLPTLVLTLHRMVTLQGKN